MNPFVPDLAIVPKLAIKSALLIPIPVSTIVSVLFSRLGIISIRKSVSAASFELSVKLSYRILSIASDELEINSRIKCIND